MRKHAANIITLSRIAGAFLLLLMEPLTMPFYTVYILCGSSDMLDGFIARKTKSASKLGGLLDSVADIVLVGAMLYIFFPFIAWERWMLWWIGVIALIRAASLAIGYAKHKTLPFLHTYANKATGLLLFCTPVIYAIAGLTPSVLLLCSVASLSAIEELAIMIISEKLNRGIPGIFRIYCEKQ